MSADPMSWLVSLEGVPSAFTATRDGIDALLRDRGLRRTTPEQTATSLLRGAHASAVLEGSTSTFEEVAEGAGDAIAVDAVRVSTELLSLVPVLGRAPLQALARIHAVASASSLPEERRGRPRDAASAERLRSLSDALLAETAAPALMVAALAHADLATAAPFPSHNGIVARAAERLVLVARGVDPASLTVPEAGHLAHREAYESNLRGYASGEDSGIHSWLLYAPEAFASGADASPLRG
ncbi:oxidoreductase [Nocardioides sp. REDSEA-S30_B4]|uniref:oxidoreductase n=1 Tax=Nocardioides sp. REDSEA-S30_B4 TaxID=1811552 RepID=UPI0025F03121|nr:oxidoreductase [Nocardioides sp. REDSEA-S30_B4]